MARSLWKGSLAFGLVQIPVALHAAEEPDELSFVMLDKHDMSPIGYERINKRTGKKVAWGDIVKGYESAKGRYVVLTPNDFQAANPEATHTIDIDRFVDLASVDPSYFERPYFLEPGKPGRKAYALLRDTMARTNKAAIARVVIRTRQHLAAIVPRGDALVLLVMRFPKELRDSKGLDLPKDQRSLSVTPKERQMAEHLVESMAGEFDPAEYKDEYRSDLMALIRARVKRGDVNVIPEEDKKPVRRPTGNKVIDLSELLAQSLEKHANRDDSRRKRKASKRPRKAPERRLRKTA